MARAKPALRQGGWNYRVRTLDNDVVFDLPEGTVVTAVFDDLRNIYNQSPESGE